MSQQAFATLVRQDQVANAKVISEAGIQAQYSALPLQGGGALHACNPPPAVLQTPQDPGDQASVPVSVTGGAAAAHSATQACQGMGWSQKALAQDLRPQACSSAAWAGVSTPSPPPAGQSGGPPTKWPPPALRSAGSCSCPAQSSGRS
jgi:hypothetical protein